MKVIIAGSRDLTVTTNEIDRWLEEAGWQVDTVISGAAPGIDTVISGAAPGIDACGELWAHAKGVPVQLFPAEWGKYGKRAGPLRNAKMAGIADALLLIWDGESRGSKSMLELAQSMGLHVKEVRVPACGD